MRAAERTHPYKQRVPHTPITFAWHTVATDEHPRSQPVRENDVQRRSDGDGGERAGARTLDLLIKSQLLYQLSYALPAGSSEPRKLRRNIERRLSAVNRKKVSFSRLFSAPPDQHHPGRLQVVLSVRRTASCQPFSLASRSASPILGRNCRSSSQLRAKSPAAGHTPARAPASQAAPSAVVSS